jgi:hypothetical protein
MILDILYKNGNRSTVYPDDVYEKDGMLFYAYTETGSNQYTELNAISFDAIEKFYVNYKEKGIMEAEEAPDGKEEK